MVNWLTRSLVIGAIASLGLSPLSPAVSLSEKVSSPLLDAQEKQAADTVNCLVWGLEQGQLAVRKAPGGEAFAGLDNDNIVRYLRGDFPWYYIRVIEGPNARVNGREGWVNANYLECFWD